MDQVQNSAGPDFKQYATYADINEQLLEQEMELKDKQWLNQPH
jgi:hypothetical protein